MSTGRTLNEIINNIRYQLKAIIRKLNINYQYIDSDDLYQEVLLYLWLQNKNGQLRDKNDSYILQGCYYYLKNYIRKNIKQVIDYQAHDYLNREVQNKKIKEKIPSIVNYPNNYTLEEYLYYDEFSKKLSRKEKTLLNFRLKGLTNREIGRELGISHTMVSKMREKIKKKYQFYNQ